MLALMDFSGPLKTTAVMTAIGSVAALIMGPRNDLLVIFLTGLSLGVLFGGLHLLEEYRLNKRSRRS
jgi:hypothetical protein